MAEIGENELKVVKAAHERYRQAVEASGLQASTKFTYLSRSEQFIRWLEGEFTPGAGVK